MSKTQEQKILELEAKVKLLEKQKARDEHLAEHADKKAILLDMLVDLARMNTKSITVNYTPDSSACSEKNTRKG